MRVSWLATLSSRRVVLSWPVRLVNMFVDPVTLIVVAPVADMFATLIALASCVLLNLALIA